MNDQELADKLLVLHEVLDGFIADLSLEGGLLEGLSLGEAARLLVVLKGIGEVRNELRSREEGR